MPSMPGIMMSRTTASGPRPRMAFSSRRAAGPSAASTTSKPSASRTVRTTLRMGSSSSTTSTTRVRTSPSISLMDDAAPSLQQGLDACFACSVAPRDLGLEGVDAIEHVAPLRRDLALEGLELVVQREQLVVAETRQRLEVVAPHDLVEAALEIGVDLAWRHDLRQPPDAGRARVLREDLRQAAHEGGEVTRRAAVAAALQLDADDV